MALAYIDANGYHYPDYPTVLTYIQDLYKNIYGVDVNINPDSQDGALIAVFAVELYDMMSLGASIYNSFSPITAQGTGLSRNVKINGITRQPATFSTVDLVIVGTAGTLIENGVAEDPAEQKWLLPASVLIPLSGTITVTATAQNAGAVSSSPNSITKITTPTRGWQTVNNPLASTIGRNTETDAELRQRQKTSTALPSQTVLDGMTGEIANITGVTRYKTYENDTNITDANGLPPHSVSAVVEGGVSADIAAAINIRKTEGCATYGTTNVTVFDKYGVGKVISFFRPTLVPITVSINITALTGYTSGYATNIKQAVSDYINALSIGETLYLTKLYTPANLTGTPANGTFDVTDIQISRDGGAVAHSNIALLFNEIATSLIADITVTVV